MKVADLTALPPGTRVVFAEYDDGTGIRTGALAATPGNIAELGLLRLMPDDHPVHLWVHTSRILRTVGTPAEEERAAIAAVARVRYLLQESSYNGAITPWEWLDPEVQAPWIEEAEWFAAQLGMEREQRGLRYQRGTG